MPTTNNPEVFRSRWNDHIEQLEKLKHTLNVDDWSDLDEATDTLKDLVDRAVEEVEE